MAGARLQAEEEGVDHRGHQQNDQFLVHAVLQFFYFR